MKLPEADRIAVRQLDLRDPPSDISQLQGYEWLWVLARLHSTPVGHVVLPVRDGRVCGEELREAIIHRLASDIARLLIERWLAVGCPEDPDWFAVAISNTGKHHAHWPKVTVAICTRDRPQHLERCLASLVALDYPDVDLLVIDNAPATAPCADIVARFPTARCVLEPRPGLDWARNRAIAEARGEIIAYTDDDVIVDRDWLRALTAVFLEHPTVMAVTGLVLPAELETPSQLQFEQNGGFSRGSRRCFYGVNVPAGEHAATFNADVGKCGTGANMAYRKGVFERIGLFDPALDVGTATNGGGDLEMFFRVMKGGFLLVYEPKALVWHHHRRDYSALRKQIVNNGVGYYSFLTRTGLHFPEERAAVLRLGAWWLAHSSTRRMLNGAIRGRAAVRDLATGEFFGSWLGMCA
ncbi:MAG TPA: glycosyltransferase family A protein, partial [Polyangiaceae bacterium]